MKNNKGFTLIEIVMVLVLLGILAAVAVPKYYDLQNEAREQTAKTVAAEFQARLHAEFAQALLGGAACSDARATALKNATDGLNADLKDKNAQQEFTFKFNEAVPPTSDPGATSGTPANVVVTYKSGNPFVTVNIGVPACAKSN